MFKHYNHICSMDEENDKHKFWGKKNKKTQKQQQQKTTKTATTTKTYIIFKEKYEEKCQNDFVVTPRKEQL